MSANHLRFAVEAASSIASRVNVLVVTFPDLERPATVENADGRVDFGWADGVAPAGLAHHLAMSPASGRHSPPLWIIAWQFAQTIARSSSVVVTSSGPAARASRWCTWANPLPSGP